MNLIGPDVTCLVFSFLPPVELLNAALVCKDWYRVARRDAAWSRHVQTICQFCPSLLDFFVDGRQRDGHSRLTLKPSRRPAKPWTRPYGHWHLITHDLMAPLRLRWNKVRRLAAWRDDGYYLQFVILLAYLIIESSTKKLFVFGADDRGEIYVYTSGHRMFTFSKHGFLVRELGIGVHYAHCMQYARKPFKNFFRTGKLERIKCPL